MIAAVINAIVVLLGGFVGLTFGKKIPERVTNSIFAGLALCVMSIGISSAIKTQNSVHVIMCIVLGTASGEVLRIEERVDKLGDMLRSRFAKNSPSENAGGNTGRFTEGFLTASLLFCVGSMAIMGSLEAGISQNYSIIYSKSLIDGVSAIGLSAAMGTGVLFAGAMVLVYQGIITLFSSFLAPFLSAAIVTEMSAIGGPLLIGTAFNMLNPDKHIRVGNMLPAIFLPILYFPLLDWITSLFA